MPMHIAVWAIHGASMIDTVSPQKNAFLIVRIVYRSLGVRIRKRKKCPTVIALGCVSPDQRHLQVLHPPTHVFVKLEKAVNGG